MEEEKREEKRALAEEVWLGLSDSERTRLGLIMQDPEVGAKKLEPRSLDLLPLMGYQEYDVLLPGGKIRRVTGDRIRPVGGAVTPSKLQD